MTGRVAAASGHPVSFGTARHPLARSAEPAHGRSAHIRSAPTAGFHGDPAVARARRRRNGARAAVRAVPAGAAHLGAPAAPVPRPWHGGHRRSGPGHAHPRARAAAAPRTAPGRNSFLAYLRRILLNAVREEVRRSLAARRRARRADEELADDRVSVVEEVLGREKMRLYEDAVARLTGGPAGGGDPASGVRLFTRAGGRSDLGKTSPDAARMRSCARWCSSRAPWRIG